MNLLSIYQLFIIFMTCFAGPLEDISAMPDLTLFYQQLIRQPDLQNLLLDTGQSTSAGDFTIFAPSNDAMTRINRKNEDINLLLKYHIVPGRYDDLTIYNMAQDVFNQVNPRQMTNVRPQNKILTLARPFHVFYGLGFYGGTGPYINVSNSNSPYGPGGLAWSLPTTFNQTNAFDNSVPLSPNLANLNNYNPNQQGQTYVVAQGSASSGNPSLFPTHLMNYYQNVFNPNVNTQFMQNANPPPNTNLNPNLQQQPMYGPMNYPYIGIPRPTINNAFILQTRLITRGIINVIDDILWPPERRDPISYKTAYDALEDAQFSRLRLLAQRSEYFRSELTSLNQQTFFLPNDQAFSSFGSGLSFLFEQSATDNSNDVNDFIRSHIVPIMLFPSSMDASKQLSTLSQGKSVSFRKTSQSDQSFGIDVLSNRQVARILTTRSEEIKFFGNGVVYPIPTILSGPTRSAADELARSYQYFMALIQQSGDTELVNILQGSTAGLGNTGPSIFNPQNLLNITVLIPQQISVQQLGSSDDLSRNLRRHILRFPVFVDPLMIMPNTFIPQQQPPFIQPGFGIPQYQRSPSSSNKNPPQRHRRRRRRQLNIPPNVNFQQQQQQIPPNVNFQQQQQQIPPNVNFQQQQQIPPIQQQKQQFLPIQQQQQIPPIQQQQQPFLPIQQQQPQQFVPIQEQEQQQQQQFVPIQQQQILPVQPQQLNPTLNPSYYQLPAFPTSAIFQDGQFYPTMDPQFSIQAQISAGPNGNVLTLIGRPDNSLPFTATVLNSEANIPIKNGVMHAIRGILSGTVIPLDTVLTTLQGANSFTQLLQQTGVLDQLKQSGRSYTLFIPTNTALQTIGVTTNMNRIRQFVLRHVCADVLLDPMTNILRRSGGYYSRNQMPRVQQQQQQQQPPAPPSSLPQRRSRRKRQSWADNWRNGSSAVGGPPYKAPDLGPGYFQPQQQVYGGYPAAPSPFWSYNQLYNPGYVMSGYANPNSEYYPGYNGTYLGLNSFNYPGLGAPDGQMHGGYWNNSYYNPQINVVPIIGQNYYTGAGGSFGGSTYVAGPQSCTAMTGERITVQPITGAQPGGANQPVAYQNFIVTCCGDQSINAMVQSFNIYPPSFAVYLIGRSLLSQGQTINNLYSHTAILLPYPSTLLIFIIFLIFIKYL